MLTNLDDILEDARQKYKMGDRISTEDMRSCLPVMKTAIKVLSCFGKEFWLAANELRIMERDFEAWIKAREENT